MLQIHQFLCLSDNYGFLLHDPDSGETVAIDTPDGEKYLAEAESKGWTITQVWNTHWHPDHAGGNEAVVKATGATIVAPAEVAKLSANYTDELARLVWESITPGAARGGDHDDSD